MKHSIKNSLALMALMTLASCGGSGGGSGGGTKKEWQTPIKTTTKATYLKNLENWKKKPFKYCDLADAFGMDEEKRYEGPALDVNLLIASNGDSAIFSDGSESVVVSGYTIMGGINSNVTSGTEFDALVELSGNHCKVTVDGKEVFSTLLTEQIIISNHWGDKEYTNYSSTEEAIKKSLRPTEDSIDFLGKVLKLSLGQPQKYTRLAWNYTELLYRSSEKVAWNSLANSSEDFSIEVRTNAPVIKGHDGQQLNFKDAGNLQFKYNVKGGNLAAVEFQKYLGTKPFDVNEANTCLKMMDLNKVTYAHLFRRCQILEPKIETLSFENGVMQLLTIKYFAMKSADTNSENFYAFKHALKKLVKHQLLFGQSIVELDPKNETGIVRKIADDIDLVEYETYNLQELQDVNKGLIEIAIEWSFLSPNAIGTDFNELLLVSKNLIRPFPGSIQTIVSDLVKNPTDPKAIETLKFANSITDRSSYVKKVVKYISLYRLNGDAKARFLNSIFQNRIGHKELDDLIGAVSKP